MFRIHANRIAQYFLVGFEPWTGNEVGSVLLVIVHGTAINDGIPYMLKDGFIFTVRIFTQAMISNNIDKHEIESMSLAWTVRGMIILPSLSNVLALLMAFDYLAGSFIAYWGSNVPLTFESLYIGSFHVVYTSFADKYHTCQVSYCNLPLACFYPIKLTSGTYWHCIAALNQV